MQYISEMSEITGNLPDWAKYYMTFTEAFLAYSTGAEINSNLRESIVDGLGKTESFASFVVQLCPEIIYLLNQQKRDSVLEKALGRVLVITKEGCFLGDQEIKGFPDMDALTKEINKWYRGSVRRDHVLMEAYAKRLSEVGCKGVVVAWKVGEKKRSRK